MESLNLKEKEHRHDLLCLYYLAQTKNDVVNTLFFDLRVVWWRGVTKALFGFIVTELAGDDGVWA